ncbi:hypothetical protein T484DRAFT_1914780 [Baffinella frigidus]|nr:hypothetical protein T484DRAFT_1914780 [Cryptophyta sp. CCMP2293]
MVGGVTQLRKCKEQTIARVKQEQTLTPGLPGMIPYPRFIDLVREMCPDGASLNLVLSIHQETSGLTGNHLDRLSPQCFWEVVRKHGISYLGPP